MAIAYRSIRFEGVYLAKGSYYLIQMSQGFVKRFFFLAIV
jgi:hypothetical protein